MDFFFRSARSNLKANLHEYNIKRATEHPGVVTFNTSSVVVHPKWDPTNYANDLAVVVLAIDFLPDKFSQIICLPPLVAGRKETAVEMTAGMKLVVIGWGATKEREWGY